MALFYSGRNNQIHPKIHTDPTKQLPEQLFVFQSLID
jgi:hypothetical protein